MMLHTKYQGCRSGGFRQEYFFMFSLKKPMLKMWHPRRGPFLVPGALSEKFGRGIQGDAANQISRL